MEKHVLRGQVQIDHKTKNLCKRLKPGNIAFIAHEDLDELAAEEMVEKRVKAVINAQDTFSGKYPAKGAEYLLRNKIYVLDKVGEDVFSSLAEGENISLVGNTVFKDGKEIAVGRVFTEEILQKMKKQAEDNLENKLDLFVQNTLEYARKEKDLLLKNIKPPQLKTKISGKHVLIVVRGKNYKNDLLTIRSYIKEVKPVLVGVDGGADAICELGFKPHIVIGDMDSVSNDTLRKAGEIIVHAYWDGKAPGLSRVIELGLNYKTISQVGTSEDVALLLAYENNPNLIVLVGAHSHMLDFLEKGRKGMSSTFLVRLKAGEKIVDARGLAHLYRSGIKWQYISVLVAAALFPIIILAYLSPLVQHFIHLFYWRFWAI